MLTAKDASRVALQQFKRSAFGKRSIAPKSTVAFGRTSSDQQAEDVHVEKPTYSNTISFSSPESDFSTSHLLIKSQYTDLECSQDEETKNESHEVISQSEWSGALSFSSPESDFTFGPSLESLHTSLNQDREAKNNQDEVATKEAKDSFFQSFDKHSQIQGDLAYSLSFASAESDFCNPEFTEMLNGRMKKQLDNSSALAKLTNHDSANQLSSMVNRHEVSIPAMQKKATEDESKDAEYLELRAHAKLLSHEDPLPRTMEEAEIENDDRAIVITEARVPFNIVKVNSAWEYLCGYTNEECVGKTLRCIQGAETNQAAVTALMSQLLRGEEAATVLTNYRKDGSKFLNRLRVGTLKDDRSSVTHFVGILKEVEEMADEFNEGSKILA